MLNIYVCGPTVYSQVHIGNLRAILTFDVYVRALKHQGHSVNLIHNITDIDDKIIKAAKKSNTSEAELASKFGNDYIKILDKINVQTISHLVYVTNHLQEMIVFIKKLLRENFAYESNGDVYFDTSKISSYGQISGQNLASLKFTKNGNKKHPSDFALWKKTHDGITYDSPFSKGRPGWHTECAVLVAKYANEKTLDIHGGGIDLLFPHHENENAQYEAVLKQKITKNWKHVGHLLYNQTKMSKVLGNILNADEFISKYGFDVLRMIFLNSDVTSPLDFSENILQNALNNLSKYQNAFKKSLFLGKEVFLKDFAKKITDWNFAIVNKEISQIVKDFNKNQSVKTASKVMSVFKILGFNFSKISLTLEEKNIWKEWNYFRKIKEYQKADKLRKILLKKELI